MSDISDSGQQLESVPCYEAEGTGCLLFEGAVFHYMTCPEYVGKTALEGQPSTTEEVPEKLRLLYRIGCAFGLHRWALRYDGRCTEWCCTDCLRWRMWGKSAPRRRHPNWEDYKSCCWNRTCRNVAEANLGRIAAMGGG